ncbi:MAG: ABC transporter permease [Candidatus Tectomicrobia bacterium]|nr:ABC transporter permease [Candidatus Tectomicrobia bacterium]
MAQGKPRVDVDMASGSREPAARRWAALRWLAAGVAHYFSVLLFFGLWEFVARSGWVNPWVFPPVTVSLAEWGRSLATGDIFHPMGLTLLRALGGLTMALGVGITLGLLMGRYRLVEWFFEPLIAIGFPAPKIAFLPLFVLWFGFFNTAKVLIVFTSCIFPLTLYAYHGARSVDRFYLWSALSKGSRGFALLRKVVLPAALPHIFDGFQVALIVSFIVAFVAEMVTGGGGLGFEMIKAAQDAETPRAFAMLFTISLLGYGTIKLAEWLRALLLFWHIEHEAH